MPYERRKSSHSIANGDCVEIEGNWRKSSHSAACGDCAEVGQVDSGVLIRDTKNKSGPRLRFGERAWVNFVASIKEENIRVGGAVTRGRNE